MRTLLLCLLLPGFCGAQALKTSGLHKLDVFEGTWKSQGDPDGSAATPPSATTTCRWSVNGAYMICDQLVDNNGATTNNLSIYSYHPDKDGYELSLVGVPGMAPLSIPITASGDTLFYNSSYTVNGKKTFARTLNVFATASSYRYLVQTSGDGVDWMTTATGRSIKISPAP